MSRKDAKVAKEKNDSEPGVFGVLAREWFQASVTTGQRQLVKFAQAAKNSNDSNKDRKGREHVM
jgi:hypothetical protein